MLTNKVTIKQLREFGYLIGLGFPLVFGWLIPFIAGHGFRTWTLLISIPTLLVGILIPGSLKRPYQAWMKIGHLLGFINSHIIFGIVFIVVLLPIASIMRAFGYDPLRSKKLNLLTYKERKKDIKVDLRRIF